MGVLGNIETRSLSPNVISRNVAIRNELDLFVNVLHCVSYAGVPARHKDIDIYVVRQNTEGEYAMMEHEVGFTTCGKLGLIFCGLVVIYWFWVTSRVYMVSWNA